MASPEDARSSDKANGPGRHGATGAAASEWTMLAPGTTRAQRRSGCSSRGMRRRRPAPGAQDRARPAATPRRRRAAAATGTARTTPQTTAGGDRGARSRCSRTAPHELGARVERAELERLLVLGGVAHQRLVRRPAGVGDDDVDRAVDRARHPARRVGRREAGHAAALGEQVRDQDDRTVAPSASASLTPRTSSGGIRLVKKLPGPMMTASKLADRVGDRRDEWPLRARARAAASAGRAPAPRRPRLRRASCEPSPYSAQSDAALDAHRPDAAAAAQQRAQAVDRGEEVAAVLLHHRQQQVAAGVARRAWRGARASAAATAARGAPRPRCAPAPART